MKALLGKCMLFNRHFGEKFVESGFNITTWDNTTCNFFLFQNWVDGLSVMKSIKLILNQTQTNILYENHIKNLIYDVILQYKYFDELEKYLKKPNTFLESDCAKIPTNAKRKMLAIYYKISDQVMREIIKSGIHTEPTKLKKIHTPISIKRQLDNCHRITNKLASHCNYDDQVNEYKNLQDALGPQLAKKYRAIAFITQRQCEILTKSTGWLTLDHTLQLVDKLIDSLYMSPQGRFPPKAQLDVQQLLMELKSKTKMAEFHHEIKMQWVMAQTSERLPDSAAHSSSQRPSTGPALQTVSVAARFEGPQTRLLACIKLLVGFITSVITPKVSLQKNLFTLAVEFCDRLRFFEPDPMYAILFFQVSRKALDSLFDNMDDNDRGSILWAQTMIDIICWFYSLTHAHFFTNTEPYLANENLDSITLANSSKTN